MRILFLLLSLLAPLGAPGAETDAMGIPLPPSDVRGIRELQSRNLGAPSLDSAAPRQEGLLAIAELGGASRSGNWSADDQAALFALLQNYRDELLGLGMDAAELESQLEQLRTRAAEMQARLDKLKPKDGLKIHGRFVSAIDDLHVFGNAALPILAGSSWDGNTAINTQSKLAGKGVRNQVGVVHGNFDFQGTRGPLSARIMLGVVAPTGTNNSAEGGFRRVLVEMRLPVALQFGDVDAALSPLTLWRNDSLDPFMPEPFVAREQRLRDDLLLLPNKWRLRGLRASSELTLFGGLMLELESLSSVAAYNSNNGASKGVSIYNQSALNLAGTAYVPWYYVARYNTYLQGWRITGVFGEGKRAGYQGLLFWDDTSTQNNSAPPIWAFRSMNSLVHSGNVDLQFGPVRIDAEGALSAYVAPALTYTAVADPLTGTAISGGIGWKNDSGHVRAFGRMVSRYFHAAGAQGRTVDMAWQPLGPMLTEMSHVGASGNIGLNPVVQASHASRLNDTLLPPGLMRVPAGASALTQTGNAWNHLLAYPMHEELDAYGAATPNRVGFGVETAWSLAGGALKPAASYESFAQAEAPADAFGNTSAAFAFGRIRAGLEIDLKPWLAWPIAFGGGYSATTSGNGEKNFAGKDYALSTTLLDYSLVFGRGNVFGAAAGMRQLLYQGLHPTGFASPSDKQTWDMLGLGGWWRPQEGTSVDLVYSTGHNDIPDYPQLGLTTEQVVLRLTTEF